MGPESSAKFFMKIIEKSRPLSKGHPPVIMFNVPVPFEIEKEIVMESGREGKILPFLVEGARLLENAGADFIVIPCNTVHIFIEEVRKSVSIPVLSIIEETAKLLQGRSIKVVGLLATKKSIESGLHKNVFDKFSIKTIKPDKNDCNKITKIIFDILNDSFHKEGKNFLLEKINELFERGAEAVVLGCTDFTVILKQEDAKVPMIDTVDVLAESAVRESLTN